MTPFSPMTFPLAFIEGLGGGEMILIMFIVLLLFGADKLPELARGFGKSMKEFKKAASGVEEEVRRAMEEEPEPQPKKFPVTPPPATLPHSSAEPPAPPPAGDDHPKA